jgi:hypothetical protein
VETNADDDRIQNRETLKDVSGFGKLVIEQVSLTINEADLPYSGFCNQVVMLGRGRLVELGPFCPAFHCCAV